MKERSSNFSTTIKFIWKNRKSLIVALVISALVSLLISFALPIEFRAVATFYPAKAQDLVINDAGVRRGNFGEFGEEEEAEQMLELMGSEDFIMHIVDEFDLYQNYNIDPSDSEARTKVINAYHGNCKSSRTRFNAIQVEVFDRDASKAASIANGIVDYVDKFRSQVVNSRIQKSLVYLRGQKDSLESAISRMNLKIKDLNEQGVISREERVGLYQALGEASTGRASLERQIGANQRLGGEYDVIDAKQIQSLEELQKLENRIVQFEAEASDASTYKFSVQKASIPQKKAKPKRSIILIVGTAIGGILYFLYLLYQDRWPEMKKRLEE